MPVENQASDRIRRFDHPFRALVFVFASVTLTAAAFALGLGVRSADSAVLDAKDQTVQVFASVESRSVSSEIRIQGEVVGNERKPLSISLPAGAERMIVTNVAGQEGPQEDGSLLGSISNRPLFLFTVDIPLFRDLKLGDEGSDVESLQKALGVYQSGKVDTQTLSVVRRMYREAESDPPGGIYATYISSREFYTLPASMRPVSISALASPGSELDASHPFAFYESGLPYVKVRASVDQAQRTAVADKVTILAAGGKKAAGVVRHISDFQQDVTVSGRPPGRDISIDFEPGGEISAGESVSVQFGNVQAPELAVPTLSVRSDAGGDFVLKRIDSEPFARVAVVVIRNANGWSAVRSGDLKLGDELLVSQ